MKIRIDQSTLSHALSRIAPITDRKSTNPVLAHIRLTAANDGLSMEGTDLRVSLRQHLPCTVETAGQGCIDAGILGKLVKELPQGEVTLEIAENRWAIIRAGRGRFQIPGIDPAEFPTLPAGPERLTPIPTRTLLAVFEQTLYAAARDESHIHIAGLRMEVVNGGNKLRVAATDGHRLALVTRPLEGAQDAFESALTLPIKGAQAVRTIAAKEDTVEVGASGGRLFVKTRDAETAILLLEGTYPNYLAVTGTPGTDPVASIPRQGLLDAVRRVSLLAEEETHALQFSFGALDGGDHATLVVTSNDTHGGNAREDVEIRQLHKPGITVTFNARYIRDALGSLSGDTVVLECGSALSPCRFISTDDPSAIAVVMPMLNP